MIESRSRLVRPVRCAAFAAVAALLLAACASRAPVMNQSVEQARGELQAAASDPDVAQFARPELDLAQDAFAQAERSWRRGNDADVIAHWAYLAQQRAATAREAARLRRVEEAARSAEADRQRRAVEVITSEPEPESPIASDEASPSTGEPRELQTTRGITVTLDDKQFVRGGVDLERQAEPAIERVVTLLRQDPSRLAQIEGHSDDTGSRSRSLELSGRRADAIRAALVARGIDPRRIAVRAMGDSFPVASNETALGRERNRRVDVIIAEPAAPARFGAPR